LKRSEDAISAYDEVVRRCGDATEPALRELVAKALVNKGVVLGALKRIEDASGVYDEVVRRFGDATEPALREQVAKARAAIKV
jgi:TolA-binding protein